MFLLGNLFLQTALFQTLYYTESFAFFRSSISSWTASFWFKISGPTSSFVRSLTQPFAYAIKNSQQAISALFPLQICIIRSSISALIQSSLSTKAIVILMKSCYTGILLRILITNLSRILRNILHKDKPPVLYHLIHD